MFPPSILSSPALSSASRLSDGSSRHSDPGHRTKSQPEFEIERPLKSATVPKRPSARRLQSDYAAEHALRASVSRFLVAKARPFTVSGRIPLRPLRTRPLLPLKALDVLIGACRPHQTAGINVYPDRDSLFYPPNLPLTATLEIANHPILDAVRNALFPNLPVGHYLITVRDRLEVMANGCRMSPQPRTLRNDGRVATIVVTLPVQYRGGTLIVRDGEGAEEKFFGGGQPEQVEWTAFLAECEYEVETIQQGCRMSISFAVHLKTYGPSVDPLISPSEYFLDLLSPVLSLSRGRKVAFYLTQEYGVNPADAIAESLVPHLKGSDSLLYHALKVYKLAPELHWAAGGYIWPIDRTVECGSDALSESPTAPMMPFSTPYGSPAKRNVSMPARPMSYYGDPTEDEELDTMRTETDMIRLRVEESGAIALADAEIFILSDWAPGPMTKERVYFALGGELEKLIVNVLMVTFVP
ncbi:hypothetical protein J3R82DRAFT_8219 [Butyriboletus roseoflavus]|nr:hypothetical protein J3R82DRAFT_8219 [Butyriboletus roseoflavus]